MSSKTVAVFPIASALSKALEFGRAVSSWRTETDIQKRWLELLNTLHKDFGLFSEQELKSMATYNCNEINAAFLCLDDSSRNDCSIFCCLY